MNLSISKQVKKTVKNLPGSFTIEELIAELIFIEKAEKGREQSKAGAVYSKEDAKKKLKRWLK